ncbi:hypothetical protein SAMN05421639_101632 [Chryseobacterium shigense]|uniref:Uncharacterized protein n=1 Tax=Chryseobacterium shigense TaxID=297244 RepID=A0A1N7HYB3_9FLAO|nr:hypothetical protein [Chryseobacterium shigense]SIS29849.1 hypothetical protein SAMN05421639_101632 [Chryseobacterium shigense]
MDTNQDKINQKIIDDQKGFTELSENDLNIYGMVYHSLEQKSDAGFPLGFSDKIIRKIEIKQQLQFNLKLYALFSVVLIMCLGFLFTFLNEDQLSMMISTATEHKYIILFFVFTVTLIQLASHFLTIKKLER